MHQEQELIYLWAVPQNHVAVTNLVAQSLITFHGYVTKRID